MLHNLIVICPVNATYISNCYMCPARWFIKCGAEIHLKRVQHKVIQHRWIDGLFFECGVELLSKEGTTQDDPTSMDQWIVYRMWSRTTSKQGTTQADPTSMGAFAHWIFSLLQFLLDFISVDEFNAK